MIVKKSNMIISKQRKNFWVVSGIHMLVVWRPSARFWAWHKSSCTITTRKLSWGLFCRLMWPKWLPFVRCGMIMLVIRQEYALPYICLTVRGHQAWPGRDSKSCFIYNSFCCMLQQRLDVDWKSCEFIWWTNCWALQKVRTLLCAYFFLRIDKWFASILVPPGFTFEGQISPQKVRPDLKSQQLLVDIFCDRNLVQKIVPYLEPVLCHVGIDVVWFFVILIIWLIKEIEVLLIYLVLFGFKIRSVLYKFFMMLLVIFFREVSC